MANRGDIIENPLLGERIVIRRTGRETGGATLQLDVYQRPGSPGPVEHLHPAQEERFEVVSGTMIARVAGRERRLGPGERIVIPAGTPHTWANGGEGELHLRAEFSPALETARFFAVMAGLARDGKTNSAGAPHFLQMVPICRAYDIWLTRPPVPVQRALFALLAPVARLRGLRASYPEYGSRAATAAPVAPVVAEG